MFFSSTGSGSNFGSFFWGVATRCKVSFNLVHCSTTRRIFSSFKDKPDETVDALDDRFDETSEAEDASSPRPSGPPRDLEVAVLAHSLAVQSYIQTKNIHTYMHVHTHKYLQTHVLNCFMYAHSQFIEDCFHTQVLT